MPGPRVVGLPALPRVRGLTLRIAVHARRHETDSTWSLIQMTSTRGESMEHPQPRAYTVSDFTKWDKDGELILAPKFQRRSVWTQMARSYLIDTILQGYPIP